MIDVSRLQYKQAIDLLLKNLQIKKDDLDSLIMLSGIFFHQQDMVSLNKYVARFIEEEEEPKPLVTFAAMLAYNKLYDLADECYVKACS